MPMPEPSPYDVWQFTTAKKPVPSSEGALSRGSHPALSPLLAQRQRVRKMMTCFSQAPCCPNMFDLTTPQPHQASSCVNF
jgi:hypothetical protein